MSTHNNHVNEEKGGVSRIFHYLGIVVTLAACYIDTKQVHVK